MKKLTCLMMTLGCVISLGSLAAEERPATPKVTTVKPPERLYVYRDAESVENQFHPSGSMGDAYFLKIDPEWPAATYEGETCVRLEYKPQKEQPAEYVTKYRIEVKSLDPCVAEERHHYEGHHLNYAGLCWQHPEGNWGDKDSGMNLTGYNKLVFHARGQEGLEMVERVKVGNKAPECPDIFPDSLEIERLMIPLSTEWTEHSINLAGFNMTRVANGFCIFFGPEFSPEVGVLFLDDIYFTYDPTLKPPSNELTYPLAVYDDLYTPVRRFAGAGSMGDEAGLSFDLNVKEQCQEGRSCARFSYSPSQSPKEPWAGFQFQISEEHWGTRDETYDLNKAGHLTFWARGEKGGERIDEFRVGCLKGKFPDSVCAGIGPVKLTKTWKKYVIDLQGFDLARVAGGFSWSTDGSANPGGVTFFLDAIQFEQAAKR